MLLDVCGNVEKKTVMFSKRYENCCYFYGKPRKIERAGYRERVTVHFQWNSCHCTGFPILNQFGLCTNIFLASNVSCNQKRKLNAVNCPVAHALLNTCVVSPLNFIFRIYFFSCVSFYLRSLSVSVSLDFVLAIWVVGFYYGCKHIYQFKCMHDHLILFQELGFFGSPESIFDLYYIQ